MTKKTWLAIVGFALAAFVVAAQADLQRVAVSQLTSTATGTQNDFATIGYDVVRWNGASAVTFTGFNGAQAGRILIVDNVTAAQEMSFSNATGSTASYQLNTWQGADLVCPGKTRAWLRYDSTLTKWIVQGGTGCHSRSTTTSLGDPRGHQLISGHYYFMPTATGTTSLMTQNVLRAAPCYVPNQVTVTRLGMEVTTIGEAGSKVRLGIYADNGSGNPGALIVDAGQINGDSATVQEITGLSATIGPGWYWFGAVAQSCSTTCPTGRAHSVAMLPLMDIGTSAPGASATISGKSASGVTGSLPNPFGSTSSTGSTIRIFVKL